MPPKEGAFGPGVLKIYHMDELEAVLDIREQAVHMPTMQNTTRDNVKIELIPIFCFRIFQPASAHAEVKGDVVQFIADRFQKLLEYNINIHRLLELLKNLHEIELSIRVSI